MVGIRHKWYQWIALDVHVSNAIHPGEYIHGAGQTKTLWKNMKNDMCMQKKSKIAKWIRNIRIQILYFNLFNDLFCSFLA